MNEPNGDADLIEGDAPGPRPTLDASDPLRRLVDAAPFGAHLYELTRDGRLIFVAGNESANRILGVDCSRFAGMTIEEAFPPLATTDIPRAYRTVALTGTRFHDEQVAYEAGEIAGVYDVYAVQISHNQVAAFFRDVTEQRRAEAERARLEAQLHQAQKMEAIGVLAGGIAHDFNNILTAITGYAELLRLSFAAEDPRIEDVEQIRKASSSAAALIRQLLAFARRETVHAERVDLGECVRNSQRLLERVLGEHIDLAIDIASGPSPVLADETELVQVILNLAVNARDAMEGGGTLAITVGTSTVEDGSQSIDPPLQPGPYIVLAVQDTGLGMDEETQRRLFEPFFTTKAPGIGTGLGLATVYGIVQRCNGGISVASAPGVGSTFTILLPRYDGPPNAAGAAESVVRGSAVRGRVLLVEDADDVRAYAARLLANAGHVVTEATDGLSALDLVRSQTVAIDVLVTDVVMPRMSGIDLAERARQLRPGIGVVLVSGYPDTAFAGHALMPDYRLVAKPFDPDELVNAVAEVLAARRDEREP